MFRLAVLVGLLPTLCWGGAVSATDDAGRVVSLSSPAHRIVSLTPHATELLFAAGAGRSVVAVDQSSDYPPEVARLPRIGSSGAIDIEAIVAQRPDLIVAWQSGTPPGQAAQLQKAGLKIFFSEPRRLEDIPASVERFGVLAGTEPAARRNAAELRRRLRAIEGEYAGRPPVRVFYEVWHAPLITFGGRHLVSEVITRCGGRNIFASLDTLSPSVDMESVVAANPQVIIAGAEQNVPDWFESWRRWRRIEAVRRGELYTVPPDLIHRNGPRLLDGMEMVCQAIDKARRP